jgi:lysyl-tRNA synthetase class 2
MSVGSSRKSSLALENAFALDMQEGCMKSPAMNPFHYPSITEPLSYSLYRWAREGFPVFDRRFYLCGEWRPSPNGEGFELWSRQARFFFEWRGEWKWRGEPALEGEPIALEIESGALQIRDGGGFISSAFLYARRLVARAAPLPRPATEAGRLRRRTEFVRSLKDQLRDLNLEEVETPFLVDCPGMEPSLEPFRTEWRWGRETRALYLPTSPELHLKKLLAQGWTDIFEIKTCFRNSELSPTHEPEFLMLEWYRAFRDLGQIKEDLQKLLDGLHAAGFVRGEAPRLSEVSYADLFHRYLDFELRPETSAEELKALCRKQNVVFSADDSWDDLFFRLSLEKIEPGLESLGPLIIRDFPPSQAALARRTPEGWADRFEFYWRGLEIANAFHELNDPEEQRRRFEKDRAERRRLGTLDLKPDAEFLRFLEWGMPPSAGVALGVERLLMACENEKELRSYRTFSFSPY